MSSIIYKAGILSYQTFAALGFVWTIWVLSLVPFVSAEERLTVTVVSQKKAVSVITELDNAVFYGETGMLFGEEKEGPIQRDSLSFINGNFNSKTCAQYGFESSPYRAWEKHGTIYFEAITTSKENGYIKWTGRLINGRLSVVYLWVKRYWFGTIHKSYWFDGARVEPKAP